jgi:phosphoglycerate dehydrogenase-like enzyme
MDKMKIAFLNEPSPSYEYKFSDSFEVVSPVNADILYTHTTPVPSKTFPNSKYILCPMTNINHLKLDVEEKREIIYLDDKNYLFDYVTSATEWVVQQIYNLLKRSREDLQGKTIAIIGYGRIGKQLAEYLPKRCVIKTFDKDDSKVMYLPKVISVADIVVCALSSDSSTKKFINARNMRHLKNPIWFINVARGDCVDIDYILEAYKTKSIKGFALDINEGCYDAKTIATLEKLHASALDNVIITHHIAGKGKKSRENTDKYVYDRMMRKVESQ